MAKLGKAAAWLLAVLAVVAAAALLYVRHAVNDDSVRRADTLLPPGASSGAAARVLALWAHPDDEITAAGTLARMTRAGAQVTLVHLTHGKRAHFTGYSAAELHRLRPLEAQAAARAIGAREDAVLDYGDGRLPQADATRVKADLRAIIARVRPSTVVSFDDRVGFYGHKDHVQAGRWAAEVVREGAAADRAFPVRRLWQSTLPAPMIRIARERIKAFRDHYPADPAKGLPPADVAVPIAAEGAAKRAVLDAHRTQVKVIDDVQPYGRKLPPWLYYRLFDREYFHLAWSR